MKQALIAIREMGEAATVPVVGGMLAAKLELQSPAQIAAAMVLAQFLAAALQGIMIEPSSLD